jgi:D-alanyl-lipoteichoic acid acyltransferase DltB (MBOAT superfamily)
LRDYLYIPLGGNRKGEVRTYVNLMITMLLGGLWHGASWTFVVWGALHGIYLCAEKLISEQFSGKTQLEETVVVTQAGMAPAFMKNVNVRNFMLAMFTFFLVNVTWVFFRAADFTTAWRLLTSMFGQATDGKALLPTLSIIKVGTVVTLMVLIQWFMRNTSILTVAQNAKWWTLGIVWALMIFGLIISQQSSDSFIYFQF